jgi:hypothetical protein
MAAIPVSAERRPTMKKTAKRLTLSRETLLSLEAGELATVAGGFTEKPVICCAASGSCPPPPSADSSCC